MERINFSIVGAGLIGASWSALALAYGHRVRVWDPSPAALCAITQNVETALAQLRQLGAIQDSPMDGLTICADLDQALVGADFVQENAPERTDLKRELYRQIEAQVADDLLIASSTSSLVWSDLSAEMRVPERFLTAHPFNPPHLMPLVELFSPSAISLDKAEKIYRGLGRTTVRLRQEAVGHVANRLASALWREAVNIVAEGIADVEEVDTALVHGPGLRWSVMGAHMAYHLGGGTGGMAHYLSHLGPSQERRWQSLGEPRLTPEVCETLIQGIDRAAKGRSIAELEAARDAALIARLKLGDTL